ncbi:hypothetical protein [Paenibacillus dendritiformis]|uniref:hypothetical protein n=1 Tax=Paenibacillus dendritiformis TaxID=130049 RepID=UPI00387E145D
MPKFRGDSDYKAAFEHAATRLIDAKIEDRGERMMAVEALIDEYVVAVGERPDGGILERLTDYILREELTDGNPHKVSHNEYPFLSESQMQLRYEREYGLELAENHDADGRNRATPTRRRRTAKEERFVDRLARMKNRKRNARYKRDTSPGPIEAYNLRDTGGVLSDEFVDWQGLRERYENGEIHA